MVTVACVFVLAILFFATVGMLKWIDHKRLGCVAELLVLLLGGTATVTCLFFAVAVNL